MWYKNKVVAEDGKETVYVLFSEAEAQKLGFGVAVADIEQSVQHYHLKTRETYVLISGRLEVKMRGTTHTLTAPGQSIEIPVNTIHSAKSLQGTSARIVVLTVPGWQVDDHRLA